MRRIIGSLVICRVAGVAIRRDRSEIAVCVALRALQRCVRAGQRERRLAVIENRPRPACRTVANQATRGETRGGVRRIIGSLVIGRVAGVTIRRDSGKVAVGMALITLHRRVRARERKCGLAVIKSGRLPGGC